MMTTAKTILTLSFKQNRTGYYELCECVNDIKLNSNIHNKQGCPLEVPGHRQQTLVLG